MFHTIFVDYNTSIELTGNNRFEWGDKIFRQWVKGGMIEITGIYLIGLICVMEIFWEMSEDLNNQKNDKVRLVVSYFSGYLCYVKMILQ